MELLKIQYRIRATSGQESHYDLNIDPNTLELRRQESLYTLNIDPESLELRDNVPDPLPTWTDLDFHQCPNCPLDIGSCSYCPVAVSLIDIVEDCEKLLSYDIVDLEVTTSERVITQRTTAGKAISSLIGLIMATSGCPNTAFFKPMARFHLPLASPEETTYRATSMYLLAQFFRKQEGFDAGLELAGLTRKYNDIHIVNISTKERLMAITSTDSSLNAIVLLDVFAQTVPIVIEESLRDIKYLFESYLK